jgi:hypothetical protein
MEDPKKNNPQEAEDNRAPNQETPSRGYGRQHSSENLDELPGSHADHTRGTEDPDAKPVANRAQQGDMRQQSYGRQEQPENDPDLQGEVVDGQSDAGKHGKADVNTFDDESRD